MNKNIIKFVILVGCLVCGLYFAGGYQAPDKTVRIYKQALKDYENGNYSNSYYLFMKVGKNSPLKPFALYRQAMCAKALGDKHSELKIYQKLFTGYPKNKLSPEAKYTAGQLVIDDNPDLALSYFNSVLKSDIDDDYKIAANYYKSRIEAAKIRYSNKRFSSAKAEKLENSFREYLTLAPNGRHAVTVAGTWLKFNPEISDTDRIPVIRAYVLAGDYTKAAEHINKLKPENVWALEAQTAYATKDFEKAQTLTETGVEKYADNVDESDYNRAVDNYLKLPGAEDNFNRITKLFSISKGPKKDYIWNLKCTYAPDKDKYECYKGLYQNFPNGKYAENAMLQVFLTGIKNRGYEKCAKIAKEFLKKYPDSDSVPLVLFWAGKIEQKYRHSPTYKDYYQKIINNYPDSYQAYRAFWILKGINSAIINTELEIKPVEYPYKAPEKNDVLHCLTEVNDYDMIAKYTEDGFIKSWVEYKKGNYSSSVIIARDAMNKLKVKPPKNDLRWRLVYPPNYYKQVSNSAKQYKNNEALMMAIIREESFFNPEAQSEVGAMGLMQLMPVTAHDIGDKHGITFNTSYLFNPELNIKLGNLYYSTIKEMLKGKDVSAIAAYNGGIGSVTRWRSTLSYNDTDEFVQKIPYEETKNYVEKVFASYWNYVRIYQKQ